MSPLAYGLVFGGGCFAAAILISVACFRAWCREMVAQERARQRAARMARQQAARVDPAVWCPTNRETWEPSRLDEHCATTPGLTDWTRWENEMKGAGA